MEHTEKEFFAHIKETLSEYELDYVPGAWEKFQKQQRKQQNVFRIKWVRPVAAAAILLLGILFWKIPVQQQKRHQPELFTKSTQKKIKQLTPDSEDVPLLKDNLIRIHTFKRPELKKQRINPGLLNIDTPMISDELVAGTTTSAGTAGSTEQKTKQKNPAEKTYKQKHDNSRYIATNNIHLTPAGDKQWKINVLVSNSYGPGGKIRLGFGSSVDYALNKKISISAGAAYTQVSGMNKFDEISAESTTRSLHSVETSVTGIDLPIEIKYSLNERNYLSIGISTLGILRKSQTLSYMDKKLVDIVVAGDDGPRTESKLVSFKESVPVASDALPQEKYLGFYNLSYGFIHQVGKNTQLIFEPYIKLPMKPYSEQRSSLMSTGIRLKMNL
ncbi:hypothetical protein [Pedobacter antarcticus]|uniref:hypothetical protein n=1 Tax=Pedobacter antarcticus TaxID=34086 RepID=UPI00292FA23B|nr:hypothetical protein [Pedobacter antarcticus]